MTGKIQARLQEDLKAALKAGEKGRLLLIRMLVSDLKNEQLKANRDQLDDDEEVAVLRRALKVRHDELETATEAGRTEAAQTARAELEWIESYLPRQMSESEIEEKAKELIAELGISSRKEQGRFMKEWMARYKAVSDGRIVSGVLGRLLG